MYSAARPDLGEIEAVVPPLSASHTVIFMNGPSLTGKTTIAARIGRDIGIPVLATREHGSVLTNGVLDHRKRLDR